MKMIPLATNVADRGLRSFTLLVANAVSVTSKAFQFSQDTRSATIFAFGVLLLFLYNKLMCFYLVNPIEIPA